MQPDTDIVASPSIVNKNGSVAVTCETEKYIHVLDILEVHAISFGFARLVN